MCKDIYAAHVKIFMPIVRHVLANNVHSCLLMFYIIRISIVNMRGGNVLTLDSHAA